MKTCRAFLLLLAVTGITAAAAPNAAGAAKRPNILFLFADDWAWPHASCLGCPLIKMPASDLGESQNVAMQHPDIVKELSALLDKARNSAQTRPRS
jgi:hypothetical protein